MDFPVQYQVLTAALIPDTLLSADYNLFLTSLGALQPVSTLVDDTGILYVGENVTMGTRTVEVLGSGTAQPGVQVATLVLPFGSAVDVVYMRDVDTDELILSYPNGAPNLLSAIALVLTIDPVGYDLNSPAPICFCRGTHLTGPDGPVPVERVTAGDQLLDIEGRCATVLAVVCTRFRHAPGDWQPIVFEAGAFGFGLPHRRLKVSPQHRVCLPGQDPRDADGLLVPAKAFKRLPRVRQRGAKGEVTYYHVITERHCILIAEGVPTESLLLSDQALLQMPRDMLQDVGRALGLPPSELSTHPAARPCRRVLGAGQGRKLVEAWAVQRSLSPSVPWPRGALEARGLRLVEPDTYAPLPKDSSSTVTAQA